MRGTRVGPKRPDLIICDDIEKDELVESPRQRRKLEHWLRRVVMPALAPGGQLLVLGSIIHYDSLLANLCDRTTWPRWDYRVYRAFEAEPTDEGKHFVKKALWPARWPVEMLEIERERIGTMDVVVARLALPFANGVGSACFEVPLVERGRWKIVAPFDDDSLVALRQNDRAQGGG